MRRIGRLAASGALLVALATLSSCKGCREKKKDAEKGKAVPGAVRTPPPTPAGTVSDGKGGPLKRDPSKMGVRVSKTPPPAEIEIK